MQNKYYLNPQVILHHQSFCKKKIIPQRKIFVPSSFEHINLPNQYTYWLYSSAWTQWEDYKHVSQFDGQAICFPNLQQKSF